MPEKLQLVVLKFCPPDVAEDEKMMVAARGNDTVSLEQLLKRPRNPNTRDRYGHRPLHRAGEQGHVEAMRLLLEAAHSGHLDAVRFLVQNGAQKDLAHPSGLTPSLPRFLAAM